MNIKSSALALAVLVTATGGGCKKSTGGGGGGGGGGWLVGTDGRMANVDDDGQLGAGYDLGSTETLYGIACRFDGEAFVVGAAGTLLYTDDGGESWTSLTAAAQTDLRALATQDSGAVFVAGDGTFELSKDGGDTWRELSDGRTNFRSLAAAQRGSTVLALSADGGLYSFNGTQLVRRTTIAGARAVAVSPNGRDVIVAGNGVQLSQDGGVTFAPIVGLDGRFEAARIDDGGEAIAAGEAGLVANISEGGNALVQHVGTSTFHTVHMQTWGAETARGYLAGDGGQVYLTDDAGWSWHAGPNVGGTILGADQIGAGHN